MKDKKEEEEFDLKKALDKFQKLSKAEKEKIFKQNERFAKKMQSSAPDKPNQLRSS